MIFNIPIMIGQVKESKALSEDFQLGDKQRTGI